jgi:hypothetical protein
MSGASKAVRSQQKQDNQINSMHINQVLYSSILILPLFSQRERDDVVATLIEIEYIS